MAKGICRKLGFVSLPTAAAAAGSAAAVASAYVINNQHVSVCRRYARAPMLTRAAKRLASEKTMAATLVGCMRMLCIIYMGPTGPAAC